MPSVLASHIQGLSDRDIARLRRFAANRPHGRSTPKPSQIPEHPWPRHLDCAVAERLRLEE